MKQYLSFDEKLAIDPQEFAAAWNASPDHYQQARARSVEEDLSLTFGAEVALVLIGVGAAVAADVIKEFVKHYLEERAKAKEKPMVKVTTVKDDEDEVLFVIEEEERPANKINRQNQGQI